MLLDKLRLMGVAKDRLLCGPAAVYIDINTGCNLNCNYCWLHSPLTQRHRPPKNMPFKTITRIMDETLTLNTKTILFTGDGEPTMHPRFTDIINHASQRGLFICLTTNAAFNERLLAASAKIDYLYINFSAPEEALYASVQSPRNPKLYNTVIKNISVLSALSKKLGKPTLTIAYIANKTNFRSIPLILAFAKTMGIKKVTFRMMEPTTGTRQLLLSPLEKKEFLRMARPLCRKKTGVTHNLMAICQELEGSAQSPYRLTACFVGWYSLFIDSNQNVGICCHNEKLVIGNLKKSSLQSIWESQRAHHVRLKCKYHFDIRRTPFKGECEWCHWYDLNHAIAQELEKL